MSEIVIKIIILSVLAMLINLPFGYWRQSVKKKSAKWFLAIHIPILIIILLRILLNVGFVWYSYPFVVIFMVAGQYLGGKYFLFKKKKTKL